MEPFKEHTDCHMILTMERQHSEPAFYDYRKIEKNGFFSPAIKKQFSLQ